ncbi:ankyrin repeat-containing domain protein [Cladochytrium replicatum]|nr:ankyrin repeat-containing domain protein [Cladochytrium replicatum]
MYTQSLDEMDFERSVHGVAQAGNLEKLKKFPFLKLDGPDKYGLTPLHYASRAGHLNVCEYLLLSGVNVNTKTTESKTTALHRAVMSRYARLVALLLRYKADVFAQDGDGRSPLHFASESNDLVIAKELVAACSDQQRMLELVDNKGKRAIDLSTASDLRSYFSTLQ